MSDESPIAAVAGRLYGLPLAEFTGARDAESRALKDAGDSGLATRVKRFKKPGAGAHLANLLVRADSSLLKEIRDLGERLRAEQADPDPSRLRALDQERRSLVARSVKAAAAAAEQEGGRATDAALRDVEQTVWAAVVDPGGFATLRAGLLVRPLSPSGFGAVDLDDASALPVDLDEVAPIPRRTTRKPRLEAVPDPPPPSAAPAPPASDPAAQRGRRAARKTAEDAAQKTARKAARAEVRSAEAELREAEESAETAAQAAAEAEHQLTERQEELAELRERIAAVEQAIRDHRAEQSAGQKALRAAEKARRAAATEADRARNRLEALLDDD